MDTLYFLKILLCGSVSLFALIGVYVLFHLLTIIKRIQTLLERVDVLTDVRGWWKIFQFFKKA